MQKARICSLIGGMILTLALGMILTVMPTEAHCPHNGNENHPHCDGNGDAGGGKDQMAALFDDDDFLGIQSDGSGLYVNGEPGIDVRAKRDIQLDLNSDGSMGARFLNFNPVCISPLDDCAVDQSFNGTIGEASEGWAVLAIFGVITDIEPGGTAYLDATLLVSRVAAQGWRFQFGPPCHGGEIEPDDAQVSVSRSEDGKTWTVTGDLACLEVITGTLTNDFGGLYSIPFSVRFGPESLLSILSP